MIEFTIAIVIAIILWNLRTAFYNKADVFKEQVEISVATNKVNLQDDYDELIKLIQEKKQAQGGKWHYMKDIDKLMHNDESK